MNPADYAIAVTLKQSFGLLLPEIMLIAAACIIFVGGTFRADRHLWAVGALAALGMAGVGLYLTVWPDMGPLATVSPILPDRLAFLVKIIALASGAVLVLFSWNEVPDRWAAEFQACVLLSIAGLSLTGTANDLVTLFLALELISIPTYVLLYLPRADRAAQEAAAKYFLLSIFSSGLLLFGFSYLYGMAGTTNIAALLRALAPVPRAPLAAVDGLPLVAPVALIMIVAGLGFKITAVPFHFYAADVYQGAPLPAVAGLAFVPKVAGFVALFRVGGFIWPGTAPLGLGTQLSTQTPILLWILAALTMSLGNVLALLQDNLKRMLAYSSVAHAGYMLIGLATTPDLTATGTEKVVGGVEAILFYLVAYGAMTIGAFGVLACLSSLKRRVEDIHDLEGLSVTHPLLAGVMALFMFSLIGMPLTAGFIGKLLLFLGAMAIPSPQLPEHSSLFRWLALIGAINAAIAAWYYLRVVAVMYLRQPIQPLEVPRSWPGRAAVAICALVTLILGVYPRPLVEEAQRAAGIKPPVTTASAAER